MIENADEYKKDLQEKNEMQGPIFKIKNDPRITKVGYFLRKFYLDEFPQFFNVLKGDLSIVGVRAPTPEEWDLYDVKSTKRLSHKPGITGLWQIQSNKHEASFEKILETDLEYLNNWSIEKDLLIIFQTIIAIFKHKGD